MILAAIRFVLSAARTLGAGPVLGAWAVLACALPAMAQDAATANKPSHGIAMHGPPALPADFTSLPYANPLAPKGGRLNVAAQGTFDGLNPYNLKAGSAAQGLSGLVYQSLMARSHDEPFTLYGLLAQTIETDEARSYATFRINPLAKFSDGKPVTSDDVLFSFDLLRTKGRPQQRVAYGLVKKAEALDERTIRYDLSGIDDRELPLTLALMPVLPKHLIDIARFTESTLDVPVGSGPYTVGPVKPGEQVIYKRDPNYWGASIPLHRGLYNFDEIVVNYYRDANSLFESFKAGLIDYRDETSSARWATGYDFPALREGRVIKEELPLGTPRGLEGFAFNTRHDMFADVRVREALAMMFDFEWINTNLFGGLYTRTKSFFDNSDFSSIGKPASAEERTLLAPFPNAARADILEGRWQPPMSDGSGRDREQAKRAIDLLTAAGWRVENGVQTKDATPLAFEIMVVDRGQERLALNYADSLKRIGVRVRVRTVDEVQYQRRRQRFDFDMMIGSWIASPSPGNEQRMRWGSSSAAQEASFNLAGASSPAIDALILAMLSAHTREDFVTAVRAYDRVLLSGFYVVPLFHTRVQWDAYWTRIARPVNLPRWASPLFPLTLDTWWSTAQ